MATSQSGITTDGTVMPEEDPGVSVLPARSWAPLIGPI